MPRTAITAEGFAPKGLPFSAAVRAGDFTYLSGQVGLDPKTGELVPGGVGPQTAQVFKNIAKVLAAGGKSLDDVVKVNVYLADIGDYAEMNENYAKAFAAPYPARTAFAVAALPLGARVEVEVIAR
ncbi:MAG: Rid family detoxifying hydrolase [Pseudomonadota bacterium]|nr:Rid family detoxifying hydrolase [Pseudomonadota bacterium]